MLNPHAVALNKNMKRIELLDEFVNVVDEIISEATAFQKLSEPDLNVKEHEKGWSILQCFDHLNQYNQHYLKQLTTAIHNAKSSSSEDIAYSWVGRKSITMMDPENHAKQKTFRHMEPSQSELKKSVIEKFMSDQMQLRDLLVQARTKALDLNQKTVKVEFFKLLKMYTGETLQFMINHELRHIRQAERIKRGIAANPVLII
jgi:uncharacterized damage-inducible protein DinB